MEPWRRDLAVRQQVRCTEQRYAVENPGHQAAVRLNLLEPVDRAGGVVRQLA